MKSSDILESVQKVVGLNQMDEIEASIENFHAMITALVAALYREGLCLEADSEFARKQGWVYLPDLNKL